MLLIRLSHNTKVYSVVSFIDDDIDCMMYCTFTQQLPDWLTYRRYNVGLIYLDVFSLYYRALLYVEDEYDPDEGERVSCVQDGSRRHSSSTSLTSVSSSATVCGG